MRIARIENIAMRAWDLVYRGLRIEVCASRFAHRGALLKHRSERRSGLRLVAIRRVGGSTTTVWRASTGESHTQQVRVMELLALFVIVLYCKDYRLLTQPRTRSRLMVT
jgi:hypothetical protein